MPGAGVIGSIGVLALVCTAAAFLLFFALIEEIGPVRATVITYINPAVAALAGITVLQETFTAGGWGSVSCSSSQVPSWQRAGRPSEKRSEA